MIFFFNDTATTEIYTLSLHDALPIYLQVPLALEHLLGEPGGRGVRDGVMRMHELQVFAQGDLVLRSEEHTSELQSRLHLVCRLLLEKKKRIINTLRCTAEGARALLER